MSGQVRAEAERDGWAAETGRRGEFTFDFDAAERELADRSPSPEDVFLREFEREVFARALADLGDLCRSTGRETQHRIFEQYDLAEGPRPGYAELAEEHGIPPTSVTNYLAWCRRELKRLVRERMERS